MAEIKKKTISKPEWLRSRFNNSSFLHDIKKELRLKSLNSVCEAAKCPNICECFNMNRATFMIMGDVCTRNCGFCAVSHATPGPLDCDEPHKIAKMAAKLDLKHVVVTSVTRDDLPDCGAGHFSETIRQIRKNLSRATIEVLTPDFKGEGGLIDQVIASKPDIFNHNIETVKRLSNKVRNMADYDRSLSLLRYVNENSKDMMTKSGLMVGLGETDEEVYQTIDDIADTGCDFMTIGQYLQPSRDHLPVKRYVEPEIFEDYKTYGESIGIKAVFSGPLVRSSYMAEELTNGVS